MGLTEEEIKKYRIHTEYWESPEFDSLEEAEGIYEFAKDRVMGDGVTDDSYVELVSSSDDFDEYEILKKVVVVIDEEKMKLRTPKEAGLEWDYWAKWQDVVEV
ncbi:hypothetical protein F4V43_01875 [Paenibacillus spiritus]|uniref:Uncharacterized protein n=1 Tax=Paenibacillus spiritus TaxID=2496557 RepID=A0A5J5GGB4_9BACL|nr:hypothetical protein [Paenibacillus spiritus]KAA9007259.1 hypothetical protein F4V43_01875 [Paenibacillus spiritus]